MTLADLGRDLIRSDSGEAEHFSTGTGAILEADLAVSDKTAALSIWRSSTARPGSSATGRPRAPMACRFPASTH